MMLIQTDLHKEIYLKLLLACISFELFTQSLLLQGKKSVFSGYTLCNCKVFDHPNISSMSLEHAQKIMEVNKIMLSKLTKQ